MQFYRVVFQIKEGIQIILVKACSIADANLKIKKYFL